MPRARRRRSSNCRPRYRRPFKVPSRRPRPRPRLAPENARTIAVRSGRATAALARVPLRLLAPLQAWACSAALAGACDASKGPLAPAADRAAPCDSVFKAIAVSQVPKAASARYRGRARKARTNASWAMSSAIVRSRQNRHASPSIRSCHRATSRANASASPAAARAASALSRSPGVSAVTGAFLRASAQWIRQVGRRAGSIFSARRSKFATPRPMAVSDAADRGRTTQ